MGLTWVLLFAGGFLYLAYKRASLSSFTLAFAGGVAAYLIFGNGFFLWNVALIGAAVGLGLLSLPDFRRERITRPLLAMYRTMLPSMSDTEREALEAGSVWWDGELFTGLPDWQRLTSMPAPKLSDEEQAFIDGPCEELCEMLDDWEVTHELADLPERVWAFIKEHKFFAMIIPKEYGGLGFSAYANAMVITKLSTRNASAASTVGVPNSLGPGELLVHYGTDEQKQRYLPGLADMSEIPCFALTSPQAGSDAAAIIDSGVVCKGEWEGEEIIGIRLNWDKRYITLAPVATVLGLAFKLYDPDKLIGDVEDYGITAALIPTDTKGVTIGRRHYPLNIAFQNGPTQGNDVFVPLDYIIGGRDMAGKGWKMLVELLSVGRAITLPSSALGGGKAAAYATGAYARLRRQFNIPIARFEGVGEALARVAGHTYIMDAAVSVTSGAITEGEKPAVPSAVLKYHCTELGRKVANDAMDIHGGKGVMLGPSNYLGRGYQATPIAITVEGANILTRSLIIFGQGAIRCHPFVLRELQAARAEDREAGLIEFDRALFGHIGYAISNAARSFWLALTHARFSEVPLDTPTRRFYQNINRYSSAFALASDFAMLTLGGGLKQRELLSARLGDVFSAMYLASCVLKHFENQGRKASDLALVEWSVRTLMYNAQEQLHGFLRNLPNRPVAAVLRFLIFPRGRTYSAPSDDIGQQLVELVSRPTEARDRLANFAYTTLEPSNPLGLLQEALELADELAPLQRQLRDLRKAGTIDAEYLPNQVEAALAGGHIQAADADRLLAYHDKVMALINVDDFDPAELGRSGQAISPAITLTGRGPKPKKKRAARRKTSKAARKRQETATES
ncbi:MAG: acyl-CoA dehydrogenase [Pseudomonadota bacterium]